jgi:hypothetical protein
VASKALLDLAAQAQDDEVLKNELKSDPAGALVKQAAAFESDKTFYRIAIGGLIGLIALVIICAVVLQIWKGDDLSDWISALATTALGAVVGLFAPSPTSSD